MDAMAEDEDMIGLVLLKLAVVMFVALACFIISRRPRRELSVEYWTSENAVKVDYSPLKIPFVLDLSKESASYPTADSTAHGSTGLVLRLSVERSARLILLWRVPFPVLSHLLNRITAGDMLLYDGQAHCLEVGETKMTVSRTTTSSSTDPSANTKQRVYPLVAVLEAAEPTSAPEHVVALTAVIHISTRKCGGMRTQVLHRYIRQHSGAVTLLQPLYASMDGDGPLGRCAVCQESPAEVVLLPCRHACLCPICFLQVKFCPICRAVVSQYFSVPPPAQTG